MTFYSCSYDTVKYVHIKDARLGVLRSFFLIGIVGYVVIFELLGRGGWLESSPIVGVVRFSLQQPTLNNCDPSSDGCINSFSSLTTLPYCSQYNTTKMDFSQVYPGNTFPCEIYEAINAQIVSERSIVVMTRASIKNQTLVCGSSISSAVTCPNTYNDTSSEYKFYIAQSEEFTILLDHAVTASKSAMTSFPQHSSPNEYAPESSNYQGLLLSNSDSLCAMEYIKNKDNQTSSHQSSKTKDHVGRAPCYISPNRTRGNQDFFSLQVLLQATGVDLDDCNPSGANASCQTYRDTGATLLLNVHWSDFRPYKGLVQPYYYYSPQIIVGSSFKQTIPFYESYRTSRTLLNAHGIKVAVLMSGEFHRFNIVTFMVTLTTALGLLAVATTIVDMFMLYILPDKQRYHEAKYEQHTGEFGGSSSIMGTLNRLVQGEQNVLDGGTHNGEFPDALTTVTSTHQELHEPLL